MVRSLVNNSRLMKASLVILAACLGAVLAQEATSIDADGNQVVYSVGLDEAGMPTTTTLEIVPAVPAGETTATMDAGDASAIPPGVLPDPTSNPVVTRNDAVTPGDITTQSTRPPVTYIVYLTIDGVQVSSVATFTPTTPTPSTTIPPRSGTLVDIATYLPPPPPSSSTTSGSTSRYWISPSAQLTALGIAASMLLGARMVL